MCMYYLCSHDITLCAHNHSHSTTVAGVLSSEEQRQTLIEERKLEEDRKQLKERRQEEMGQE